MAVGLTPQLLPAIISINLAHGAKRMATKKVIVKRLASIENFGSMNVLCSDKTGTLTEGVVKLQSALNVGGQESEKVLFYAFVNASYETGYINPIDEAIRKYAAAVIAPWHGLFVAGKDLDAAFDLTERIDTNAYCLLMSRLLPEGPTDPETLQRKLKEAITDFNDHHAHA